MSLDDGHFQAGNSIVDVGKSGGVDNAKANPFARLEDPQPILCRTLTVDDRVETLQILNIRRDIRISPNALRSAAALSKPIISLSQKKSKIVRC